MILAGYYLVCDLRFCLLFVVFLLMMQMIEWTLGERLYSLNLNLRFPELIQSYQYLELLEMAEN